jgi:hypothetical protein
VTINCGRSTTRLRRPQQALGRVAHLLQRRGQPAVDDGERLARHRLGRRSCTGRTCTPAALIAAFASAMVCSPKWKMLAASTPVAWPSRRRRHQMLERADATARDDRHADGVG